MGQLAKVDFLSIHTEHRLRSWAWEISRGGLESLDFPSINILSKDWGCSTGQRRIGITDQTWETELVVCEIHKESREAAIMLRAVYLGHGRWVHERKQDCERLLRRTLSTYRFWAMFNDAFDRARAYFEFLAKTS